MFISILHKISIFFILSVSFMCGALFFVLHHQWIDFSVLEQYNPGRATIVLDDEGQEWARFQLDRREPVTLDQIPEHLVQAFIAAEDWSFFKHQGISFKGIVRSILVNIYHGSRLQGASTITQQLVKLLFLNSQKSFSRKIKEQVCALVVERQFTKEQILQTYLNHVYFGCGIYGVQAASQRFWAKDAKDLSIDEAALLAGIVRSPAHYSPLLYPLSSQKRRNLVLRLMRQLHFIDQPTYEHSCTITVQIKDEKQHSAPHLRETVRLFLEKTLGSQLYTGGFVVQTTLNKKQQEQAQQVFEQHCAKLKKELLSDIDGALIAIDRTTGAIKALVGGFSFAHSKFNRVHARRQIGSIIKPLIYAAAMQAGMNFAHTEIDEPITIEQPNGTWEPKNFNDRFNGQVTLAYAISQSNNIVAIKTLLAIGAQKVVDLAKSCRFRGPFHTYPSLALGCLDATLLEVVGMFNVFANNGVYVSPHYITWIKDQWGTKIFKMASEKERVMSSQVSDQVGYVLQLGLQRVHSRFKESEWIASQAMSKTGTTNDSRTCWYVGSTPQLTTAIYIGCDDNRSMGKNIYPFRTALPIWLSFNREIPSEQKVFTFDPSLHEVLINEYTGAVTWNEHDSSTIKILV
ncbi:MAG: PBP1A family penicillin-binding protein [bacterium]|nr:PBP1A family penicillin-binding protein [bacterium]